MGRIHRTGGHRGPWVALTVTVAAATMVAGGASATAAADDATAGHILLLQSAVVAAQFQGAVGQARQELTSAQGSLAGAQSRQMLDQRLADQAAQALSTDQAQTVTDVHALATDTTVHQAAAAAVAADRQRLRSIAVEMYVGTPGDAAGDGADLQAVDQQTFASVVTRLGATLVGGQLARDVAAEQAAAHTVAADRSSLAGAQSALADAERLESQRASVLSADAAAVATATGQDQAAQAKLAAAQAALAAALAAVANPPGTPNDGSPSIVGPAALDARQLTAWFNQQGYVDLTSTPIAQLAGWYVSEGAAEKVRGDIAFAQAVVETGGFASADAVGLNNYAGIGHCDTCPAGMPFGSPQLGVRAQIQLLHTFADPVLTAAQLAAPLAAAAIDPQSQAPRGCCPTWQSLTGRWATDPQYGQTILSMYSSMLSFALAQVGH